MLASLDSSRTLGSSPSSIPPSPPVADPQPAVGQAITCDIIRECADFNTTDFNTTDEVDIDQVATDEVADYSQVVIIPRVQQRRLLTLLEQGLSMLTPNNPTSASVATAEFIPFSAWYSQRWKVAYEHESLCKLHTAYNHPGQFGTKGRSFYKLEKYIADRCIVKPHYFWTRRREKEIWLAVQCVCNVQNGRLQLLYAN